MGGWATRERLASTLKALAGQGVYLGTSSWKYRGWCGSIYDEQRYVWRGRFAQSRFDASCLGEYAETFPTVCVDAAYYKYPDAAYMEAMVSQVPPGFLFALKVTDEITIKRFTNLARFGEKAGMPNESFLNAEAFQENFLRPCSPYRNSIGLLIFEFSKFYPSDFSRGREFVEALDGFLGKIPRDWPYGVEIRNKFFLKPAYFECLAKHGVTHVYNSWGEMPSIGEQVALPESATNGRLVAARFLLKPGRKYEQAVNLFSPYQEVREPLAAEREAGASLVSQALAAPGRRTLIYVNNRLEGHAPTTIAAMVERAGYS